MADLDEDTAKRWLNSILLSESTGELTYPGHIKFKGSEKGTIVLTHEKRTIFHVSVSFSQERTEAERILGIFVSLLGLPLWIEEHESVRSGYQELHYFFPGERNYER